MFTLLKRNKEKKEIDAIVLRVEANMANNYKDSAQEALKELEERIVTSELKEREKLYYKAKIASYKEQMKAFTHKDQKPYWT